MELGVITRRRPRGLELARLEHRGGWVVVISYPIPRSSSFPALTKAEAGVVQAALRGERTRGIARARNKSARTVANQLAGAFRKLGVQSRAELAARSRGSHEAGPPSQDLQCEALRAAVLALRAARVFRSASSAEAVSAWRALTDSRWEQVDQFEHGGQLFVVLFAGDALGAAIPSLTERERRVAWFVARGHSNKFVAYELGVTESSVATYLRRALSKLGVRSRLELAIRLGGDAPSLLASEPTSQLSDERASAAARAGTELTNAPWAIR